jgi:hypothetical protein
MNKLLICKIDHKEFTEGKIKNSGHIRRILKKDSYLLLEAIEIMGFLTTNNIVKIHSDEIQYFLSKYNIQYLNDLDEFVCYITASYKIPIVYTNKYSTSYWFIEWLKSKIVEEN